jgi:hypothetical protein
MQHDCLASMQAWAGRGAQRGETACAKTSWMAVQMYAAAPPAASGPRPLRFTWAVAQPFMMLSNMPDPSSCFAVACIHEAAQFNKGSRSCAGRLCNRDSGTEETIIFCCSYRTNANVPDPF